MRLATLIRPAGLLLFTVLLATSARAQYGLPVSIPGAFVDISTTGTAAPLGDGNESRTPVIDVSASGLVLPFYESNRTSFQMSNNGFLTFSTVGSAAEYFNSAMPFPSAPNAIIAPFWDDLAALPGQGAMHYLADVAGGRLIVQWSHYGHKATTGSAPVGDLTFQAHLYTDGRVEMHYATMDNPGVSYTVGVESSTGLLGVMRVVNGVGESVGSGTGVRFPVATGPVAAIIQPAYAFANSGACLGAVRGTNFLLTNQGVGPLTVTGATVTGSPAFTVDPSYTFPATLLPSQSRTAYPFPVLFNPTATDSGVLTATVTVTTDAGPFVLTVAGAADAGGAGFAQRSSLATGACGAGVTAPGTAFIPVAGHTRVTTYTSGNGDNGRFALDLAQFGAAFPSVRLFGADLTALTLTTNGLISAQTTVSTSFYGNLPSSTAAPTVQAVAMNLKMDATVAADDAGVAGAPGLFYGLSDVDGDGRQDLVVTWWHAYDVGASTSPPETSLPGPAGQYLTAQAVFFRGARANEDARVEVRILDGVDANGVPFRQNTDVADATTDKAMDNDAITGIADPSGFDAAIYRTRQGNASNSFVLGGPLYAPGGGSVGVRFEPASQATATGNPGWRMLAPPVRDVTVGRLAGMNLVQSVAGQYPSYPADNLYTGYDGSAFVPAADVADVLAPGQGVLWYLFGQDLAPDAASYGGGTSRSFALPMRLEATGAEATQIAGAVAVPLQTAGDGWNLLGNPFRDDLDISTLASFASGGTLVSAVPQVWNPNVGATGSYETVSGSIAAWQGFMLRNATATAISYPASARNTTGTFLGRSGALASQSATQARIGFELAATLPDGRTVLDRAASLVFTPDAVPGWDLLDADKLAPLAAAYATVGFQGAGYDGEPAVKAQESRPLSTDAFDVPLVVDAVGTAPGLVLSWDGLDALPETWAVELRDVVTGQTVDMRHATSYAFDQAPDAALSLAPQAIVARTTTAAQAAAGGASRFVLHVATGRTTATEGTAPAAFALAAPAPNPTATAARIAFDVPEAAEVTVAVYDLLGRRVAVLAQGQTAAGRHEARIDSGALAPGVYVIRMAAGTFTATRRVTVVR